MKKYFQDKHVLVTGAHGFLGIHVMNLLEKRGVRKLSTPKRSDLDLREKDNCAYAVRNVDLVIHLAARVGGIGYNQKYPGKMFYDNVIMGTHLMEEARKAKVKKFVSIGTVCSYPKIIPIPFEESNLWDGYPEETNAPYGLSKKMQLVQAQAYRDQYGFDAIHLLPVNMYGPHDNFEREVSHVIPALIRRFHKAKESGEKEVVVWGTGQATREFLYVEDGARAILLAAEHYNEPEPVNIGSRFEISIRELAQLIKKLIGYKGRVCWDRSKPDGQPRRKVNITRAKKSFGFEAEVPFDEGLKQTIDWYIDQVSKI